MKTYDNSSVISSEGFSIVPYITLSEVNNHVRDLAEMSLRRSNGNREILEINEHVFKEYYNAEHVYVFMFGDGVPHVH